MKLAENRATRIWLDAKKYFESQTMNDESTLVWSTPNEAQKQFDAEERARIERIDALFD